MTTNEKIKYEKCCRIIELAKLITAESDKDHYFVCYNWINGKMMKISSKDGVSR